MSPSFTMPRTALCAAVSAALKGRSGKQTTATSRVRITRNRSSMLSAFSRVDSCSRFVDSCAVKPRDTPEVRAGATVEGEQSAPEGWGELCLSDARPLSPWVRSAAPMGDVWPPLLLLEGAPVRDDGVM